MRKLISAIFLGLFIFTVRGLSQEKINYQYIDSMSYRYYLDNNWKELINVSKAGLKNDIDYYYLRMRAGIAYYERGNYSKAQKFFRKALDYNDLDEEPNNYLFYSNLFLGNKDQAKYLYHKYNRKTGKLPEAELKPVSDIILSSAWLINTDKQAVKKMIPDTPLNTDGYQMVTSNLFYNSLLLKHDISPSLYFTHSFGMIKKNNYYINSYQDILSASSENASNQYQYYASLKYIPGNNLFITLGMHYINFSSTNILYREINSGIGYSIPGIKQSSYVSDISVYKSIWLMNAGAGLTYANLNNYKQFQQNYSLAFYPLGNLNLYLVSKLNLIKEKPTSGNSENNILTRNTLGLRITKNLWFEGTIWNGSFRNAALNEGWLVMNANENITSKYDLSILIPLKKMQFGFFVSLTDYYTSFHTITGINTGLNRTNFNSITYLISIKWNI